MIGCFTEIRRWALVLQVAQTGGITGLYKDSEFGTHTRDHGIYYILDYCYSMCQFMPSEATRILGKGVRQP